MNFTRRELVKLGLAAIPLAKLKTVAALARPDSNFHGVQIGIIVSPYNYRSIPVPADQFLNSLVEMGISAVEIQDVRCEVYAGAPGAPRQGYSGSPGGQKAHPMSAQERAEARRQQAEEITQWRLTNTAAALDKYKTLRRLYEQAGVSIYAFRLANVSENISDAEYDYFFNAAKTLGANQITVELPADPAQSKHLGELAAKHKIMMGYHNHTQVNEHSWDVALAQSEYNGIQLDIGHFAAAINGSPIPFIKEHHGRITGLHLKDRKYLSHGGANLPWGEGETPVKEVLRLMAAERYNFPAGIELEYPIPAGSTPEAEIKNCVRFCKEALA
jgi:sugar phosphate isomerase/epimerase